MLQCQNQQGASLPVFFTASILTKYVMRVGTLRYGVQVPDYKIRYRTFYTVSKAEKNLY